MAAERLITPEFVRATIDYDPETGVMRWKHRNDNPRWSGRFAGKPISYVDEKGYIRLTISHGGVRLKIYGHQAAFIHYHGRWPKGRLDHANGNKTDNRIANIREATDNQNAWNKGLAKNNTSGVPGVYWFKQLGKWTAKVCVNRKGIHLGYFDSFEEAVAARIAAAEKYYGEFSPHRARNDNE